MIAPSIHTGAVAPTDTPAILPDPCAGLSYLDRIRRDLADRAQLAALGAAADARRAEPSGVVFVRLEPYPPARDHFAD